MKWGDGLEEVELASKAIKRDEQAFLQLMKLHKNALYRTAFAFLKNEHEAIEAMQEVTFRAFQKIHTVKEPAYMKTWLIRIMINYCQDQLKKKKRITSVELLGEIGNHSDNLKLEIEEALASLSKAEQQLIYLKYYQDTKIKEIAALEKIPEGTVKSRLHKALKSLRNFLAEKKGT
ncbi:sigma-70 family RNA polymerase sigma factor [Psychrobacillus lasiicapitis]|uniref:Sigma-70 family RNA polymerase sigma factor n=1 Tax=Psychrobacillus lasiicapitis TaxID=1636719 RepID=A0A544TC61_9BACI|nr:sigma-70 family RNA polymerase sigma factor [Psychrobacillus lasiicapitis]TQR15047.1 sigma-70 family RNA polymerase sigma factor [Psychrobacillus lasiicapitis]